MATRNVVCLVTLLAAWSHQQVFAQLSTGSSPAPQVAATQPAPTAVDASGSLNATSSSSASAPETPAAGVVSGVAASPAPVVNLPEKRVRPFSKFAIGTKSSTLGAGGQLAVPLTRWLNLRGGVGFFNFGYAIGIDGASYEGQIHLKNGQVSLDIFPFKMGFHISPGLLIYRSSFSASVYVPGGNTFDLGNDTYSSSATDPVMGTANVAFSRTYMPDLTIGFSNMITKGRKHWSVPLEVGAAYTGHYAVQLALRGSACVNAGCMSTSSPLIQQSLATEEGSLTESAKHYQIYPIISSGLAYRF